VPDTYRHPLATIPIERAAATLRESRHHKASVLPGRLLTVPSEVIEHRCCVLVTVEQVPLQAPVDDGGESLG